MEFVQQFAQQLINGLVVGLTYSLIALGYTMVFGILGFINFAHGDVYMIGAFLGLALLGTGHLGFTTAMILAMVLTAVFGVAIEFVAYRPVRRMGKGFEDAMLVSAIGVSIFLETLAQVVWGDRDPSHGQRDPEDRLPRGRSLHLIGSDPDLGSRRGADDRPSTFS